MGRTLRGSRTAAAPAVTVDDEIDANSAKDAKTKKLMGYLVRACVRACVRAFCACFAHDLMHDFARCRTWEGPSLQTSIGWARTSTLLVAAS